MSGTIWIHYARPRPHWYRLSDSERAQKLTDWEAIGHLAERDGATRIGQYHVRGQHDFQTVELWQFPSAEAAFAHWSRLTGSAYNEWFAFSNNIGLSLESAAHEHTGS